METIILNESTTWSLKEKEKKRAQIELIQECCEKQIVEEQTYKKRAFESLEKVTCTIQNRRISLSGHVFGDESSPAQKLSDNLGGGGW